VATVTANARLWEPVQPIDRGDRYEDPLTEALAEKDWGKVTGGGSQLTEQFEIEYVDLVLELEDRPEVFDFVCRKLTEAGAPKNSELVVEERAPLTFGASECVAIYLDGVNLPDHIYGDCDPNDLIDQIHEALGAAGECRHSWDGPTETALYLYGANADEIWKLAEPVCRAFPLCQNARIVLRLGHSSGNPKEIRLPME
jgi:hypothetical protein